MRKGLLMGVVTIANAAAWGSVTDHGAQVLSWAPRGAADVLWVSDHAVFSGGVAIRGGIPVCFPWFGPGRTGDRSPAHGFARITDWELDSVVEEADSTVVTHTLRAGDVPVDGVEQDFRAVARVRFAEALEVSVEVVNLDGDPMSFEIALHTYLAVGDVTAIRIEGLDGAPYIDKVLGTEAVQSGDVVIDREIDRIYASTARVRLWDPLLERTIDVTASGSSSTVIWNPWVDRARALKDFGDDEWRSMVCIETAAIGSSGVVLAPGQVHTIATTIAVIPQA